MSDTDQISASKTPGASNVRWQFIDSSNNSRSNLRQVKRHVMQEYMRHKKSGARQSESEGEIPRPRPKRGRPRKNRIEKRNSTGKSTQNDAQAASKQLESIVSSEPQSMGENSRCDIKPKHNLFIEMPANNMLSGVQGLDPTFMPPFHEQAPRADVIQFSSGYVDTSLYTRSSIADNQVDAPASWSSTSESLSEFEESPRTMLSTAHTIPSNSIPSELSLDGQRLFDFYAKNIPAAFTNNRLGMFINWQDCNTLPGYDAQGPSLYFENHGPPTRPTSSIEPAPFQAPQTLKSMPSPQSSTSSSSDTSSPYMNPRSHSTNTSPTCLMDEIHTQCEEFLDLLRRYEQLALFQRSNPTPCDLLRHTAVQETSPIFQILASPPGAQFTSSGDRNQSVARLAVLVMLNAALWDYRYTPLQAGNFLRTLEQTIVDSEACMNGSVEAVLQILLECNDGYASNWSTSDNGDMNFSPTGSQFSPDFSQYSPTVPSPSARPWYAGRMLKIAKRLGADLWCRVGDFLFSCLSLQVLEPTVYLWEADLRREILDASLTSPVMPALM
ncbi:hypothetical protein N7478_009873 [Penicillium angulare]|uniref:uncharacterized protein n=1 Tax=Penicillium angulare TaxID=116970 RepID=UPI00253FE4A4|nr:uncharacterized protein N7478_009873 [Penicillium angulare]KAJ5267065.1 hypothetical protein N7478_009873 [Penicillium angulare]